MSVATTEENAVVRSAAALLEQDAEVADAFLLASLYVVAVQRGESPREVCDRMFVSLPSASHWPELRDALLAATSGDD